MSSPENVAGVKVTRPCSRCTRSSRRRHLWDNSGNNRPTSKQAAFVMNVEHLRVPRRQRQDLKVRLFPVPPAEGHVNQIDTWAYGAFKNNPTGSPRACSTTSCSPPTTTRSSVTGGRWVPVYKRLFEARFWKEKPAFKHFIDGERRARELCRLHRPGRREVLNNGHPKMIQRVLVDNWEACKALDECTRRSPDLRGHEKG